MDEEYEYLEDNNDDDDYDDIPEGENLVTPKTELTEKQIKDFQNAEINILAKVEKNFIPDEPVSLSSFDEGVEHMKTMPLVPGTNFSLLMEEETDGGTVFKVYNRPNQPCQGGEMRKYWSTHGERCTRPFDHRPGDLKRPFPQGRPVAVAHDLWNYFNPHDLTKQKDAYNDLIDTVYGPDSPYLRGFGSPDSILKITAPEGYYKRMIFTDTKVDPTVLVNSLQYKNSANINHLKGYREAGFTDKEALALMMLWNCAFLFGAGYESGVQIHPGSVNTYYFSAHASLRRIFEADPNDLSSGTYYDGYDYNRPEVQNLFMAQGDEIGLHFPNEFNKLYFEKYGEKTVSQVPGTYNYKHTMTPERLYEVTQEIFEKFYRSNGGMKEVKLEAA